MTKPTEPRDDYYAQMKSSPSEETAPKPKILKIKTRRTDDVSGPTPTEQPAHIERNDHKVEVPKAPSSDSSKSDTQKSLTLDQILAQKNKIKAPKPGQNIVSFEEVQVVPPRPNMSVRSGSGLPRDTSRFVQSQKRKSTSARSDDSRGNNGGDRSQRNSENTSSSGENPRPSLNDYFDNKNRQNPRRSSSPTISFEKAAGDVTHSQNPRPQGSRPQNGSRPQWNRSPQGGGRPSGQRPQGQEQGDRPSFSRPGDNRNNGPRTNMPGSNTQWGDSAARKPVFNTQLDSYSAAHKDAPHRTKKSKHGAKKPEEVGAKKAIKVVGDVVDTNTFRRSKQMKGQQKREKSVEDITQTLVDRTGQEVSIPEGLSVKEFSDKVWVPLARVIQELMKNGMLVTLNSQIDFDTCFLIGEALWVKILKEASNEVSVTDLLDGNLTTLIGEEDPEKLTPRAPIVSIMGHVDHGKTSILDYMRKANVASGEAGGITQKIGAYQASHNGSKITFLDTPGHEAFTIMRARGAKLTDLAVIVVAADEGVKPQTIESINHAKAAEVPIIVAINKMDKEGANPDFVKGQLAEQGLHPEEWGGTTVMVPVSAHTWFGIDQLLEMILLSTEIMELKADANRRAVATVVESHLDPKVGPLATVLVNTGTLKKGDFFHVAGVSGRIRAMKDFRGKNVDEAGPSVPVQISGLSDVIGGGDILQVVDSAELANARSREFTLAKWRRSIHAFDAASLDLLMNRIKGGNLKQLKIVLKCDSNGSLEALKAALQKLSTSETSVTIIHAGVGDVTDSDVLMAGTSAALLVSYNVGVLPNARTTLAQSKIEFIDKKVIYHILERIEWIVTGMVDPKYEEVELWSAVVKAIFYSAKEKQIIGLGVKEGKLENRARLRIIRDGKKVGSGEIVNLKSGPLDVHEIEAGEDCGISYKGDTKPEVGDTFEAYKLVIKK